MEMILAVRAKPIQIIAVYQVFSITAPQSPDSSLVLDMN
jgi:hypothetical protein